MDRPVTTRFAPSPTGSLHLGHAYSAIYSYETAMKAGGRFLLRIEDTDLGRSRPEFEQGIYDDLTWLGLSWETPVRRQSEHLADYTDAIDRLADLGLVYPCFCSRKEIAEEIARAAHAPHGPDGPLYPGTCRALPEPEALARQEGGAPFVLRLNVQKAAERVQTPILFYEQGMGPDGETGKIAADPVALGDIVLMRRDSPASYHVAVTVDDHLQGITHVTRGQDIFHATGVQRLLQELLGYEAPVYCHHTLVRDESGRRLAKRDKDRAIKALRAAGWSPQDVRNRLKTGASPIVQADE